jgi:acetyl esterase/lipase
VAASLDLDPRIHTRRHEMTRSRTGALVAIAGALAFTAAACSSGSASTNTSTAKAATSLTACPSSSAPAAAGGAAGGAPAAGGAAGGVSIPVAKTIKPSDTSKSVVYTPSGPQIQCGQLQLATYDNLVYSTPTTNGKQISLKLDLQVPKTAGKKPLVIYITGGGFAIDDKTANLNQRTYVADQNYVVASIEYRTVPEGATYKQSVSDVKSAIRYLRAHADQYGIDTSKVAVWGQSAGGYLASMTGVTNGDSQYVSGDNLNESSDVQAVVDEFGPSDISKVAADYDTAAQQGNYAPGNSLAQFVFGSGTKLSVEDDPSVEELSDPITHVTSSAPPFILLQGSKDQLVSPSQTLILFNALRAKGVDATRYVLTGANHGDLTVPGISASKSLPWSTTQTMGYIVSFLNKKLGS